MVFLIRSEVRPATHPSLAICLRCFIFQKTAPAINPTKIPTGPEIKIPNKGPWFESGTKMIGPKKPIIKLMDPTMIPPITICEVRPFLKKVFFQT